MDAFKVHRLLIDDYKSFAEGFVDLPDGSEPAGRADNFSEAGKSG